MTRPLTTSTQELPTSGGLSRLLINALILLRRQASNVVHDVIGHALTMFVREFCCRRFESKGIADTEVEVGSSEPLDVLFRLFHTPERHRNDGAAGFESDNGDTGIAAPEFSIAAARAFGHDAEDATVFQHLQRGS